MIQTVQDQQALCVGINTFRRFPTATLRGCVNDANAMAALVQQYMHFAPSDVTVLTDENATKRKIMDALQTMVDRAVDGDLKYLVFSLSSHGTQIPDTSGDETDKTVPYDEAFCPHDLRQAGKQWDPDFIISDDELNDLFSRVPSNVLLEVYLDTCHSGTGLKADDLLLTRQPRFLPPPSYEAFIEAQASHGRDLAIKMKKSRMNQSILWAACRPDQTSADAEIEGDFHGAFTYYLCKEIENCQNQLTRREILQRVRADLKKEHFTQIPQLELNATSRGLPSGQRKFEV